MVRPMRFSRVARTAGAVGLIVVLLAVAAVVGYLETRAARTPVAPVAAPRPTGVGASALAGATATASPTASPTESPTSTTTGPEPEARVVAGRLRAAVQANRAELGPRVRIEVRDVDSGRVLYDDGGTAPGAPASTAKLLTAAAVTLTRGPDYRIPTRLRYRSGTVTLVGGGDPTLTAATGRTQPAYPDAARLSGLVAQFRARHLPVNRIVVDDAAFAGPTTSPAWDAGDVPSSYGAAITAVMTDGGRAAPGDVIRSAAPDLAAGRELAQQLGRPRLPVTRGAAPRGSTTVATVRSAPVSVLIEQMLQESDNVIAECLARQVAMAEHDPVTFLGAAKAIREVIGRLGIGVGDGMVDGSGLAASDRLTVGTLAAVLRLIAVHADGGSGRLARLGDVLAGLPVAAWSGTLDDRYVSGTSHAGAGVVRAKTGTLTGVSALAGLVHDSSGRLLAFAFLADRTGATPRAEAGLDRLATALARL